jgi:hypothetical protein
MTRIAIIILGLFATLVQAQETPRDTEVLTLPTTFECDQTDKLFDQIFEKYGEQPFAVGKTIVYASRTEEMSRGDMAFWINPKTMTWTITVSFTDGVSCITSSGSSLTPLSAPGIQL